MATTRDLVLKTLLTQQKCTINDLAAAVGINPISVRHHVTKLEASGLVSSDEERHGVGRPRRVYFLTEQGVEQFPTRYLQLTVRLLSQIKENFPDPTVKHIFKGIAKDLIANLASDIDIDSLSLEERLDVLQELLKNEGFTIQWEKEDDKYRILETSCPFYHVGQTHPEICIVDESLISNVLIVPVVREKCILDGDSYCSYILQEDNSAEIG